MRTVGDLDDARARASLHKEYSLDDWAANNLIDFLNDERRLTGIRPTDRNIVIQRFRDEIGDWRIVVLSPFGARIHAPWALLARANLRAQLATDVDSPSPFATSLMFDFVASFMYEYDARWRKSRPPL